MNRVVRIVLVFILFIVFTEESFAQDSLVVYTKRGFTGNRPKIGVVLSGGGAKGIAHIGFLRVMEEAGIHPDYIAGTSMGSIVGALYAIGFSVDSIQSMVEHQSWSDVLSNKMNYRRVNMEEKNEYGEYFAELPVHGWKPGLPSGAIKGQELELLFEKLTISVAKDTSFDQFYIPYRAVATDLLTGSAYVFKDGPLSIAMRASMSIPSIMQPVKKDSMLLVDGGLVENFPVRVVKDMGADIVIGVYTGGQLLPEEDLTSLIMILKQSSLMGGILDAKKQRKNVDIYIEPALNDMSAADFNSSKEFYARGYKAASKKKDELVALANYMKQFNVEPPKRPILTDSVYITGIDYSNIKEKKYRRLIENVLGADTNIYMKSSTIKEKIDRLYGTRMFRKVSYYFEVDSLGNQRIVYDVIPREAKHLNFALHYRNESKIGLIANASFRNVFIPMSKLDFKVRISEFPAARVRYFTYLDYGTKFGASVSYNFYVNDLPVYNGKTLDSRFTRYLTYIKGQLSYYPGINSSISIFSRLEALSFKKQISPEFPEFSKIKSSGGFVGISYEANTFDDKYFTTQGIRVKALIETNFSTVQNYIIEEDSVIANPGLDQQIDFDLETFLQGSIQIDAFKKLSKKWVMNNEFYTIVSSLPDMELVNTTLIGGMYPSDPGQMAFWGIPENTIFMSNGVMYRLGFRYQLVNNLFFAVKINGVFFAEDITKLFDQSLDGNTSYIGNFDNYVVGAGLEMSYRSPIGPISVGISANDKYSGIWSHIRIGFMF
jgi:NTE family protein